MKLKKNDLESLKLRIEFLKFENSISVNKEKIQQGQKELKRLIKILKEKQ